MRSAVLLLTKDTKTGKRKGYVYYTGEKGAVQCDVILGSDQKIIIATGVKAIGKVLNYYLKEGYEITSSEPHKDALPQNKEASVT
jgi:hypothetical protein